ncbi:ABC transporter ATP-binding protein [Jeongeupia naejangsanensis]|uniref:ATP-binding cassette domain-containing protein n=1 Tax=Jeongeupia naejangsanensis TaxID=613195 RepID=A0ABS2BM69_9NEIS|nr:ATP-binding cassette domain-containing protein [Jeongeupia naejangsanensis]MBM3116091.1 ATP-binding cassette domain-containing protein [Jeongeupia naejangsanensis]
MSIASPAPLSRSVLDCRSLGKRVAVADGPLDLLADISFSLPEGESLAIVGASGSGKSTLLALLAGLDLPSSGSVMLAGTDLASLDEDGRARLRGRLAGFVFQSFQLLPELTALENVMLPLELASRKGARDIAAGWLERVGLGKRLEHTPRTLSGGEQQRVALARAFCTGPRILFADEPTGSLDTHTGEKIADLLFELNRETGATLVLVTHDEALAARCSASLRIAAGRVVEQRGFAA